MSDHDYTQGQDIPEEALSAENFEIGGTGATNIDPNKVEADNSFHDLEPGDYLLKVAGFGDVKKVLKTTYLNGEAYNYESHQVEVRFSDDADPAGRIRAWFLLPPEDSDSLLLYNQGTNAYGKAGGFQAQAFVHFIDRLLPGEALVDAPGGGKVLSPRAKGLANWKGRKVWAQVEMGRVDQGKLDPTTRQPFPARVQVKSFSYKPFAEGQASPYGAKPAASRPGVRVATPAGNSPLRPPAANGLARAGLGNV